MTEPRSDTEIRADVIRRYAVTSFERWVEVVERLANDAPALLDALSAALAAKEAAEAEARELRAEVRALRKPSFDELLRDPFEQFDKHSEVLPSVLAYLGLPDDQQRRAALMKSIEEYRNAPPCAAPSPHVWHEMTECPDPAACWYEPHREVWVKLERERAARQPAAAPSEPQETTR